MEDYDVLKQIIKAYPNSLTERKIIVALISDYFPQDRLKRNILMMVYDEMVNELCAHTLINKIQFHRFTKLLVQNYGISKENAEMGLKIWLKALDIETEALEQSEDEIVSDKAIKKGKKSRVPKCKVDYEYIETDNGLKITKYTGFDDKCVIVPNRIQDKDVYEIGNYVFKGCVGIEKIIISEGIKILGNGVFKDCKALKEVVLPNSLIQIGTKDKTGSPKGYSGEPKFEGTFEWSGLQNIIIPSNVEIIGQNCFMGCHDLEQVQLPDNLKTICEDAFYYCDKLKVITFPKKLKKIEKSAFYGCKNITNLEFPKGLISIQENAFKECKNLQSVKIPRSVRYIGTGKADDGTFGERFSRSRDFTIYCEAGSYAMDYARMLNIKCAKADY